MGFVGPFFDPKQIRTIPRYTCIHLPDIHGCEAKWIYHLENAAFFREGISPLGDGKRIGEIKWQQDFITRSFSRMSR